VYEQIVIGLYSVLCYVRVVRHVYLQIFNCKKYIAMIKKKQFGVENK